jgi:preprotein translocase subunit YajC
MPHLFLISILAATKTTSTKSSGGSSYIFIVLILFVAVYFFFLRPRQQRARAAKAGAAGKTLSVGDEVVTIGGILGVVSSVDGDAITVEVGPGNHLSFLRRAVNLRTGVAGAPQGTPYGTDVDAAAGVDHDETYDDGDYEGATYDPATAGEDESWDDEEVAGEEHPSGSSALGEAGHEGTVGETGDDQGGRGEGR